MKDFKSRFSLEDRKSEAERILNKYPNRIPIIVEMTEKSNLPPLDKQKYLVPSDLTIGQFIYVLRKRIKITSEQAIFLFINNTIPKHSLLISEIYHEHKHNDNFLYIYISSETTFG